MTIPNVRPLLKPETGRPVANHLIITTDDGEYLQSYKSIITCKPARGNGESKGKLMLDKNDWDYSPTTSKYRNIYLGETTAETRKKIKSGEYILTNLNK